MLVLISCGEENAIKIETLYILEENKDWLIDAAVGSNFIMIDNNNISQSFSMNQNNSDFSPSTTSILGINTKLTKTESYTQEYRSIYSQQFLYILTAGFDPFGDNLTVRLGDVSFTFDFKFVTIARVNYDMSYKSKLMTDKGYEENDKIYSSVELIDTINVNNQLYFDVLHFSFNDFTNEWTDFTITEIYLAKHTGLVKYELNNGIIYERQK